MNHLGAVNIAPGMARIDAQRRRVLLGRHVRGDHGEEGNVDVVLENLRNRLAGGPIVSFYGEAEGVVVVVSNPEQTWTVMYMMDEPMPEPPSIYPCGDLVDSPTM